ncbi:PBP1A family penicillin-binding protein [Patescibacteria group bacterium]|nr:PBP1A family penicillin-binding protein [Patescibacteria group bacterium]MBU1868123.1 PBP1A family penicillin-binding protein [Patescibacteria group bacterium]
MRVIGDKVEIEKAVFYLYNSMRPRKHVMPRRISSKRAKHKNKFWVAASKRRSKIKGEKRVKRERVVRIISWIAIGMVACCILGLVSAVTVVAFFSKDLPSPNTLTEREIPQSTKIFSRDGHLLYEIYAEERRTLVELKDIPQYLIDATLATEDADFYKHRGFDIRGFVYALYRNILTGSRQGGSTIPQQLVKNVLLSPEKTLIRKIKEFLLALEVERRYSKDEILQMYLNEVPYGGQAWGVGAASEMYFGKHVRDVSLAEATLLAGLPQSPTYYSPFGTYPENAKARQEYVLTLMVKHGSITQEEADEAKNVTLHYLPQAISIKAPHFVMFVKNKLVQEFGEKMVEQGGLRVVTTLDMQLQKIAEEEVKYQLDRLAESNASAGNAGLVSVDPEKGEILAMVGSKDYFDVEHDGNVNVTLAERQPGSSIKPIMYVTAFEMGYTPATYLSDIRTCWNAPSGDFCPLESDGKYWGPMLLRDALANSRNVPAVKMLQQVGIQNTIDTAHAMGITTLNEPERYGLSLTLGGGEVKLIDMVQAFSVFARGGVKTDITPLLRVEDSKGKVLKKKVQPNEKRVLDEKYVYLINNVLSDNVTRQRLFGARNLLEIGRPAAVKTGTTNDNRDAWCIGYTPQLVTGIWVGNNDNSPMAQNVQGSTGATPIWHHFMRRALEGQEVRDWERPDSIIKVTVDLLSGKLPQEGRDYANRTEIFVKDTEPTQIDDFHITVDVCKDNENLLATDYHIDHGLSIQRTLRKLVEINSDWQSYTDRWIGGLPEYQSPPTEYCAIEVDERDAEEPIVEIKLPEDGAELLVYGFDVEAEVYTNSTITKVEFYWDDILVEEVTSVPYAVTYSLSMNEQGEHQIVVKAFDSEGDEGSSAITVHLPIKEKVPTPTIKISPTLEVF